MKITFPTIKTESFKIYFLSDSDYSDLFEEIAPDYPDLNVNEHFPDYQDGNLMYDVRQELKHQDILQGASVASWLLARLWFLTEGKIQEVLPDKGFGDGGAFTVNLIVALPGEKEEYLAVFYIEFQEDWVIIGMQQCAQGANPITISEEITQVLSANPREIASCRIVIEDPERHMQEIEYGWDGTRYLGAYKKIS